MAGDRLGQLAGANHDDRNRADGAATEYPEGNDPANGTAITATTHMATTLPTVSDSRPEIFLSA